MRLAIVILACLPVFAQSPLFDISTATRCTSALNVAQKTVTLNCTLADKPVMTSTVSLPAILGVHTGVILWYKVNDETFTVLYRRQNEPDPLYIEDTINGVMRETKNCPVSGGACTAVTQ